MPPQVSVEELDISLLKAGPIFGRLIKAGMPKVDVLGLAARIVFFVCITWVPVSGLCIAQGLSNHTDLIGLFFRNFTETVRFLLVVPLLIFSEVHIQPWLNHTIRYFVKGGLITEDQLPQYLGFVRHAQHMKDSWLIEIGLLLIAFSTSASGHSLTPQLDAIPWLFVGGKLTWAGVWYRFIAIPVCRFLWLRWLLRIVIWWALLAHIATLKLNLLPTHPDCRGGLGFLSAGHNNFSILWFTFSVQFSAVLAQEILYHEESLNALKGSIVMYIVLMVLFSILPLLVFTPNLVECRRKGLYEYGILAQHFSEDIDTDNRTSSGPDASSVAKLADKFKVVGNMSVVAFGRSTLLAFALAVALPLCPLLLTIYPLDQLLDALAKKLI